MDTPIHRFFVLIARKERRFLKYGHNASIPCNCHRIGIRRRECLSGIDILPVGESIQSPGCSLKFDSGSCGGAQRTGRYAASGDELHSASYGFSVHGRRDSDRGPSAHGTRVAAGKGMPARGSDKGPGAGCNRGIVNPGYNPIRTLDRQSRMACNTLIRPSMSSSVVSHEVTSLISSAASFQT